MNERIVMCVGTWPEDNYADFELTVAEKRHILNDHSMNYKVLPDNSLIAEEVFSTGPSKWADTTGWTCSNIRNWLGY